MNPSSSTILCIIGFKSFCLRSSASLPISSLCFFAFSGHLLRLHARAANQHGISFYGFIPRFDSHTHAHAATVYFARAIINKDTTFSIRHFLCVCTTKAIANGHCKHTHTSAPEEGQRDKYPMIVLLLSFVDSAMLCCSCSSTVQWTWT